MENRKSEASSGEFTCMGVILSLGALLVILYYSTMLFIELGFPLPCAGMGALVGCVLIVMLVTGTWHT